MSVTPNFRTIKMLTYSLNKIMTFRWWMLGFNLVFMQMKIIEDWYTFIDVHWFAIKCFMSEGGVMCKWSFVFEWHGGGVMFLNDIGVELCLSGMGWSYVWVAWGRIVCEWHRVELCVSDKRVELCMSDKRVELLHETEEVIVKVCEQCARDLTCFLGLKWNIAAIWFWSISRFNFSTARFKLFMFMSYRSGVSNKPTFLNPDQMTCVFELMRFLDANHLLYAFSSE